MHIAHFNIARLRALPGDSRVAGFIDNVPKVNAIAERSPGFVWRLDDTKTVVDAAETFQAVSGDPRLAISLSVWETPDSLRDFVINTVHGSFLRRREEWFLPWLGRNYVIWPVGVGHLPSLQEGEEKLQELAENGANAGAFDLDYLSSV